MAVTILERPQGYVLDTCVTANINEAYAGFAVVNYSGHGLVDGDHVYIQSNIESYNGFWFVNIEDGNKFKIRRYELAEDQAYIVDATIQYCKALSTHGVSCVHLPITYRLKSDKFPASGGSSVADILTNLFDNSIQESLGFVAWVEDGTYLTPKVTLSSVDPDSDIIGFAYNFTSGVQYTFDQTLISTLGSGTQLALTTVTIELWGTYSGGSFSDNKGAEVYTYSASHQFTITPTGDATYISFKVEYTGIAGVNVILGQTSITTPATGDVTTTITGFGNDNGYTAITLNSSIDNGAFPEPFEFINISGATDSDLDGIYQIIEVVSPTVLTINLVYDSTYSFGSASVVRYYNNYQFLVNVYGGLNASHTWVTKKPYELLGTMKLTPDSDGEAFFSVNEILKSQIELKNNLTLGTLPNNIDYFTQFYIEVAESYDDSLGSQYTLTTLESDFESDQSTFEGMAVQAKLPFKNQNSGYMSDYIGNFLTLFTSIKYLSGTYQDISVLIDDDDNDYYIDISGTQTALTAYDKGIYRIPITQSGVYSIYKSATKVSDDITVTTDSECSNQTIYLTWLNYLGGMEPAFAFTGEKDYNIEIEDSGVTNQNIILDWPNSYGSNADTIQKQTFRTSRNSRLVRSQHLTLDELNAIQYIKTSPLVQIIDSRTDRRTVIVDSDSFTVRKDRQDLFEISFTISYTDTIPSQSL